MLTPSNFRIKQIQVGWKGWIYILGSLREICSPLEDQKSATFFKITDVIAKLGHPTVVRVSTLLTVDDLEVEVSKLKEKWDGEFESLSYFFDENIRAWTFDYVDLNNNVSNIVIEARDEIIEIEKEMFAMKIKQDINIPPFMEFITKCLEKLLVVVVEIN